jgi:hypothetical protein
MGELFFMPARRISGLNSQATAVLYGGGTTVATPAGAPRPAPAPSKYVALPTPGFAPAVAAPAVVAFAPAPSKYVALPTPGFAPAVAAPVVVASASRPGPLIVPPPLDPNRRQYDAVSPAAPTSAAAGGSSSPSPYVTPASGPYVAIPFNPSVWAAPQQLAPPPLPGGGGGGGGGGGLPDDSGQAAPAADPPVFLGLTQKQLLVGGALAVGAFLLFRKGRPAAAGPERLF